MTNDYSVGLYSIESDDIYHSAFGALTEAYEKFIKPLAVENILRKKKNIKVLDICYGSGYNTKALIETLLGYSDEKYSVSIDCVDTDKDLIFISPFLMTYVPLIKRLFFKKRLMKNNNLYKQIRDISSKYKRKKSMYKISNYTNTILMKKLIKNFGTNFVDEKLYEFMSEKDNNPFFNQNLLKYYKFIAQNHVSDIKNKNKMPFVHNIYYRNVSKRYKYISDYNDNNLLDLKFYPEDIRTYLKNTETKYDIVLLDGFTPAKCPCIWSQELFIKLFECMKEDSILVTYNTSAPVRNALLSAGFYIGNSLDLQNNIIGTIASKKKSDIRNPLTEKQMGLLKTKAGIPYRDKNMSLDNSVILLNREKEVSLSTLPSSSKYLKEWELSYEK